MSPTLNVDPTLVVIPCTFFGEGGGILDLQCCNHCHLPSDTSFKFVKEFIVFGDALSRNAKGNT